MQWIAVALSWLSGLGAFWPGGYEMSQDSHTQSATVFALVVSFYMPYCVFVKLRTDNTVWVPTSFIC